jgi:hypothetical protein
MYSWVKRSREGSSLHSHYFLMLPFFIYLLGPSMHPVAFCGNYTVIII